MLFHSLFDNENYFGSFRERLLDFFAAFKSFFLYNEIKSQESMFIQQ